MIHLHFLAASVAAVLPNGQINIFETLYLRQNPLPRPHFTIYCEIFHIDEYWTPDDSSRTNVTFHISALCNFKNTRVLSAFIQE
jgi:hypothetical protein